MDGFPSSPCLLHVLLRVASHARPKLHPRRVAWASACAVFLGGCGDDKGDTGESTLPEDTATETVDDTAEPFFPVDTSADTGFNQQPEQTMVLAHLGVWQQSPVGGPYTALTGTLEVLELLNGDEDEPWCRVTFALTGALAEETCPTCDVGYIVEHYVVQEGPTEEEVEEEIEVGGLDACMSPDLPEDLERWHMGWSEAEGTVYFNYYDSEFWLPWYDGAQTHDDITFAWTRELGVFLPEEDD
jgi:hypothetical protein